MSSSSTFFFQPLAKKSVSDGEIGGGCVCVCVCVWGGGCNIKVPPLHPP